MAEIAAPPAGRAPTREPAGPPPRLDFEIVPLKGLPIVAVVMGAAHRRHRRPTSCGRWSSSTSPAGRRGRSSTSSWAWCSGPIMGKMSIPARIEFTTRLMPKMVLIMPTVVTATLAAGWQLATYLGTNLTSNPLHGWVVASMIVVGVMAILALGLLEPANVAVLFELKKPRPNPEVIERLMKRFIYSAGVLGVMQVATLVIMTKLASG